MLLVLWPYLFIFTGSSPYLTTSWCGCGSNPMVLQIGGWATSYNIFKNISPSLQARKPFKYHQSPKKCCWISMKIQIFPKVFPKKPSSPPKIPNKCPATMAPWPVSPSRAENSPMAQSVFMVMPMTFTMPRRREKHFRIYIYMQA